MADVMHAEVDNTYVQNFDEHVMRMVQQSVCAHGEVVKTQSHLMWLHREYSKVLVRSLELDRREADIVRRENALRRDGRKSRGARNDAKLAGHAGESGREPKGQSSRRAGVDANGDK